MKENNKISVATKARRKKHQGTKVKQRVSQFGEGVKSVDMFGQGVTLNIAGKETFQTWGGALLTLIVYGFSLTYAAYKFINMINFDDTSILTFE